MDLNVGAFVKNMASAKIIMVELDSKSKNVRFTEFFKSVKLLGDEIRFSCDDDSIELIVKGSCIKRIAYIEPMYVLHLADMTIGVSPM